MKRFLAAIALVLSLAAAAPALAQVEALDPSFAEQAGLSTIQDPRVAVVSIIRLVFTFLGILATLIVLYAGFTWMTAGGDEEKVSRAKKILTAGVIGLIITISAFGIASFIISRLTDAINQGQTGGPGGGGVGGGGLGGGGTGGSFRPTAITPSGDLSIRNVVVTITFASAPTRDTSNINANIVLERAEGSGRGPIAFDAESVNNTIKLRSTVDCPDPNSTLLCFDADTQYFVTVRSGLRDVTGTKTVNCGITAKCSGTFKTGSGIATEGPTGVVTSPTEGQSVPEDSIIQVQTRIEDDNGIGGVDYYADGSFYAADGAVAAVGQGAWTSAANWDTAPFTPVRSVPLSAKATNIADLPGDIPPVRVTVRAAHCFNGSKDFDETAADCGGADCGFCGGGNCTTSAECQSGECVAGVCIESPRISDVQARDGKPGNLITILGARFGTAAGEVTFLGSDTPVDGDLGACVDSWSPTQIIVRVPEGAQDGPISVTTAAGKTDATNDSGPVLPDFDVNETARPGICSISPLAAKVKDSLTIAGSGFGTVQTNAVVEFLPADASCALVAGGTATDAGAVPSWTETSLRPNVPNVPTGVSGMRYLVRARVAGEASNPACVLALPPEAGTEPRIEAISPDKGSSGTYVTLRGTNFGGSNGKVEFKSGGGTAYGDVNFPAQCGGGFWDDLSVTIKVPKTYTAPVNTPVGLLAYQVKLIRGDGRESNTVTFTINQDPLRPGVCRITPDNGPENMGVTLYGEGFGSVSQADIPGVLASHPDTVSFFEAKDARFIGLWRDGELSTSVPVGAKSGPVVLRKFSGATGVVSNGITFQVRDCRQQPAGAQCSGGETCCGDGACRPSGECALAKDGGFAWQFSTGKIPLYPVVQEDATCQTNAPTMMPSPNPYKGSTGVCSDIANVTARFSLPMDRSTLTSGNVVIETCGDGERPTNCAVVPVTPRLEVIGSGSGDTMIPDSQVILGVSGIVQPSMWYRMRIKDGVRSAESPTRASQQLDGDFDNKAGGDYVSSFKTGAEPCELAAIDVQPSPGLIDSASQKLAYKAFPLSERCAILTCEGRATTWSSSDPTKASLDTSGGSGVCDATATPLAETAPGPDIAIRASVDGKNDEASLKIDYANPVVQKYGPRDCTIACNNTVPFAAFNTDMATSGGGSILSNMRMKRCKNESCLAFEPAGDVPAAVTYTASSRTAYLTPVGTLAPNTFYRVIVDGDARSTSDAALSGINWNGDAFSWIFRTRTEANACGVQAVSIEPKQTVLQYITQIAKVNAIPKTSPDACSADGQVLNAISIDWSWREAQDPLTPDAFTLAPYHPVTPPATLRTSADLLPRCTTQCLYAGSFPVGTGRCGNGTIEAGEECEGPGTGGCSQRCLRAGSSAATCGDGTVQENLGEACDAKDQNGKDGSGCTINCRHAGSASGGSVCGNGSTGQGEACDDGNTISGDGCSAECLFEGAEQNVPVCGNGLLEEGEQCDWLGGASAATALLTRGGEIALGDVPKDPKRADFACSNVCLLRGTSGAICGNGTIDYTRGESCDAGSLNGSPGSGCSSSCTKTGSQAFALGPDRTIRAFCGDGDVTIVAGGGGEDCEATKNDLRESQAQFVTALNRCSPSEPMCTGNVFARASGVESSAEEGRVIVECSCRHNPDTGEDLGDCNAFGGGLACGAGACCFPRPGAPTIVPTGGNACRNTLVTVTFPEAMNETSLTGNLFVVEDKSGCDLPGLAAAPRGIRGVVHAVKSFVLGLFGREVSAAACTPIQGGFKHERIVDDAGRTTTVSTFTPEGPYAPDTAFRVVVRGGVRGAKNANGVGYAANPAATQAFTTGKDICRLQAVEVDKPTALIQTSSRVAGFTARPIAIHDGKAEAIAPIPGYAWTMDWSLVPGTVLRFQPVPAQNALAANVQAAAGKNGTEQLVATATITQNTALPAGSGSDIGMKVSGKSDITVMLCENPWPARDTATGAWEPYVDPATHFTFFYCRDKATGDPLPALKQPVLGVHPVPGQSPSTDGLLRFCRNTKDGGDQPKSCVSNADCGGGDACVAKDLFFQFIDGRIRDAIGVRVYENERHEAPADWYVAQRFTGSPSPATIDGYSALQDPKTLYVSVPDKYGDPQFRSYMYVFGLGDTADARVTEVFKLLTANLRFNTNIAAAQQVTGLCKASSTKEIVQKDAKNVTCTANLDCQKVFPERSSDIFCDAPKDKLRRDARRWEQLVTMTKDLDDTKESTGFYPKIEAGSFIRGLTTSKWPSWGQSLGKAGTQADPINAFNQCDKFGSICSVTGAVCTAQADCDTNKCSEGRCTASGAACTNDAGCDANFKAPNNTCRPRFEADTCFDNKNSIFMCPVDSQVFMYRAIGGVDYRLDAEFESDPSIPWTGRCGGLPEATCISRTECVWDATCKDRIDIARDCRGPIGGGNGLTFGGNAVCGNGVVEAGEECEIGTTRVAACPFGPGSQACDTSCKWKPIENCPLAGACGNGAVEQGESCDDGQQTGQYNRCRSGSTLGCSKRCVDISVGTSYPAKIGATCVTSATCGAGICTDRMNFCGDGVKNGNESCDEGAANGQYGRCAWDCRGPAPFCGDSVVEPGRELCDGNKETMPGICWSGTSPADTSSVNELAKGCAGNADCDGGQTCRLCAPTADALKLPRSRTRSCYPASAAASQQCTFTTWSACQTSGSCGNGTVEGAEECDLGSANSLTAECLPTCKKNTCGDGVIRAGVEQCDAGSSNGVRCVPGFNTTCNYCKQDCTVETISGDYCGDGKITAPESCDFGSRTGWCSRNTAKSCGPGNPCGGTDGATKGFCRKYTGPASATAAPPPPSCGAVGDSGTIGCTCPSGYTVFPAECRAGINCQRPVSEISCRPVAGAPAQGDFVTPGPRTDKRCLTTNDCGSDEFCEGGDGECLSYGSKCTPGVYSNLYSSPTVDTTCASCSTSCVATKQASPRSCGDSLVQAEFGESCDGVGDIFATSSSGTSYECAKDCRYAGAKSCGNNVVEAEFGEIYDQGSGAARLDRNGAVTGKILDAVDVQPVQGIDVQLWQGNTQIGPTVKTDAAGRYTFVGLETKNTCKAGYHIRVPETKAGQFGSRLHQLPQNGYQAIKVPSGAAVFSFRGPSGADPQTDVKSVSGTSLEMKEILLPPKLGKYEYLVVVDWTGSLGNNFLDLHLKRPGDPANAQGTYWKDQGNATLESGPHHAYLYCFHEGGDAGCSSFDVRPETMHFKFRSTAAGEPYFYDRRFDAQSPFRAWITDYSCGGAGDGNAKSNCSNFRRVGARVFVYNDKGLVEQLATPTGDGGYWHLFEVTNRGEFRLINQTSSSVSW